MNTTKKNNQKVSESGKKVDKPKGETNEFQNIISSDSILAEKDEVKNAEEKLRLKKKELKDKR
jgi:cell division protein FtsL